MVLPRTLLNDIDPQDANLRVIRGKMPEDIGGAYFICSPDPRLGGPHGFYGNGVLYRLSLEPGKFGAGPDEYAWRHSPVATPGERFRQRHPDEVLLTPAGNLSRIGMINGPNTAQVAWGDRLLVTWDGGRPVEVCPHTMEFLGELGHRSSWDDLRSLDIFPSMAAPAHPVTDPELGCLWNVSYWPFSNRVSIVMADGSSDRVKRWPVIDCQIDQVVHTITVTRNWILLCDNGMMLDVGEMYGLPRTAISKQTRPVYAIRKADLLESPPGTPVKVHRFPLNPECMHFYAHYDDSDKIRVVVEHSTDSDIAMSIWKGDLDIYGDPIDPRVAGMYGLALSPTEVSMIEIDPEKGTLEKVARYEDPEMVWNVQTSAKDWTYAGLTRPTLHHVMYNGWRREGISERQFDLYAHRIDSSRIPPEDQPAAILSFDWNNGLEPRSTYQWPDDAWATSPAFAARRSAPASGDSEGGYAGGEAGGHDGYLVVSVLRDRGYEVDIFDANEVGKGPVATLAAPGLVVPFVIHSSWMPHTEPAPDVPRTRFGDEWDEKLLATAPKHYRQTIRDITDQIDDERTARGRFLAEYEKKAVETEEETASAG